MYIATQCRQHHLHGTAIAPSTPDDAALPAVPIPLVIAFSSSVFILTASAASLSSFSQDTLASISEKKKRCRITALQFRIGYLCAAFVTLPQRSVPACLGRLEAAASLRILVNYALRGTLDGVPTGPLRCAAAFLARCPCEAVPLRLLPIVGDF